MWNHMIRGQDMAPTPEDEFGWDTHNDIFPTLKDHLLPRFDRSLSALLEDLEQRGLLDETLVVCMGEFGRAPRVALEPGFVGGIAGRKHWAGAYSVLVAGAGVAGGNIVGATNAQAGYPRTTPFTPCDLAATMFAALGIDPSSHCRTSRLGPTWSVPASRSSSFIGGRKAEAIDIDVSNARMLRFEIDVVHTQYWQEDVLVLGNGLLFAKK